MLGYPQLKGQDFQSIGVTYTSRLAYLIITVKQIVDTLEQIP